MPRPKSENQSDRFIKTAKEQDFDEDEGRSNDTLKRVAPSRQKKVQPKTEYDPEQDKE